MVVDVRKRILKSLAISLIAVIPLAANAGGGKLLEAAGVSQMEGSGGGGLVPWATIAGYGTDEELAASIFTTRTDFQDYRFNAYGAAFSLYNRVELSLARQSFDIFNSPNEIEQTIVGAKARVAGDLIYSYWPQVSVGVQYKKLHDSAIAESLGARDSDTGVDAYVAFTKAHLAAAFGYNVLWDVTLRATKANQFGLLGFGGDDNDSYELMIEGAVAVLLSRHIAVGFEYRQKPDNLGFVEEDDAYDAFIAYIPNKHFNLAFAWAELGTMAGSEDQSGIYFSLTGYVW
ncbi:DUF3034 family protein [Aurantivibrio plasticivorans]